MSEGLEERRNRALDHYRAGRFREAVQVQVEVVNAIGGRNPQSADDQMRLAAFLFASADHAATAKVMEVVVSLKPDDPEALSNYGTALSRIGRFDDACRALHAAARLSPDMVNVRDALCSVLYRLGRTDEAREQGNISLRLKDAGAVASGNAHPIPAELPAFDPQAARSNIISYSLWGDAPRYCDGAVANAEAARDLYPGWTCRFHIDGTVPRPVRDKLAGLHCQLVEMTRRRPFDGLFWRFLVINDGTTRHFLVRDADAVINRREAAAVAAWLGSGKAFHVMRDWWTHTELMLAGMWGGTAGILPPLQTLLAGFTPPSLANWHVDQWFLRQCVWPTVRNSVLMHDRIFSLPGSQPFPKGSQLPDGHHVGQDASVHGN